MNKMPFTAKEMQEMGYAAWRILPDGDLIAIGPMAFGNGRLYMDINPNGYERCYCYDSMELAEMSMNEFDPETQSEPQGWKRDPFTGRRRENGDASTEYISM